MSAVSQLAIQLCIKFCVKRLHLSIFFYQVLKVEESTLSYHAELDILDSVICKAKAMKVTFHPDKCPTEVQIDFEEAKGWVLF